MSDFQIVLNGHVDRQTIIDALAASSSYIIDVKNYFSNDAAEDFTIDIADLSSLQKEAFYKAIDIAYFEIEENAFVWKIVKTPKTFNLENSFIRDRLSTETGVTPIADGTPLKVRFETAGFLTNPYVEIDLWYNDDFDPLDVTALADIGINITGNGAEFTIDNAAECKVSFSKPSGVTDVYVIDYKQSDEIIPA
jgi:hypothetical protein